jgi:hypothetical protein
MVVDECAVGCNGDGDIDMSIPGLKASTGFAWDRKNIEWDWIDCNEDENSGKWRLGGWRLPACWRSSACTPSLHCCKPCRP